MKDMPSIVIAQSYLSPVKCQVIKHDVADMLIHVLVRLSCNFTLLEFIDF